MAPEFTMIRFSIQIAGLALVLMLASAVVWAQGSGFIEGIVVAAGSSTPVPRANVTLETMGGRDVAVSIASVDGHFELPAVAPGEYRIFAWRDGFVFSGRPSPVTVVVGRKVDVALGIAPAGVITGRVVDWDGLPVAGIQVQVLSFIQDSRDRRVLAPAGSAETNDLGEYRIYWVQPGSYFVRADPADYGTQTTGLLSEQSGQSSKRKSPQFVSTYFPNAIDAAGAMRIDLRSGETFSGADIRLIETRKRQVSGIVSISSNRRTTDVLLTPRNPASGNSDYSTSADGTGVFSFDNVVPGSYLLTADAINADGIETFGRMSIDVGNVDVGNLSMVLGPGFDLRIRLTIEGRTRRSDDPQLVVKLRPEISSTPSPTIERNGDEEYTIHRFMPGDYSLEVLSLTNARGPSGSPLNGGLYLKSALFGGSDVLSRGLHIDGPTAGTLDIIMADGAETISGSVLDEQNLPAIGVTVVLVPESQLRGRSDLFMTGFTDAAGKFKISGIPPGQYKAFSWEITRQGEWQYPEFLDLYENRGQPIRIDGGRHDPVSVRLISPRD